MEHEDKTRDELLDEIKRLSLRIAKLEAKHDPCLECEENYLVKEDQSNGRNVSFSIDITEYDHIRRELSEIKTKYRLILDAMPAHISYVDTDEKIRFVNKWHEKWFRYHPKEIVGKSIKDVFGDTMYRRLRGYIHTVLAGNEVVLEKKLHNNLPVSDLAAILVPHKDETGKVTGFYILAYDISDRVRAEEALRKLEREKDLIIDSVTELVIYHDVDLRIVWANTAAEEAIGASRGTLRGSHCHQVWHHRDRPCDGCPVLSALQTGVMREREISTPDGRTLSVRGFPVRDENGKIVGAVEVSGDITERKNAEERLIKSEMQLAQAQHLAHLGSWEYDFLVKRFHWSEEMFRICDMKRKKSRITFKDMLKVIHPDDLDLFKAGIETAFTSRNSFSLFHRIIRPNGTVRTIHSQGKVLTDEQGNPVSVIGTAQDVTARKRAEEILKRKHHELKQFNRVLEKRVDEEVAANRQKDHLLIQQSRQAAMGEMIGNIAHQWRQPLTTISLLIQNLGECYSQNEFSADVLDDTIDRTMQVIQYMSHTIDDFRNFFKPDKEKTVFSVGEMLHKTISFLDSSMKYHNITTHVQADQELTLTGYSNEYAQVLLNILTNAKDAFLEREIASAEISIKAISRKSRTIVTISDNAGGIPEDIIGRIFDPYFTTKEIGKGTGVGLYMSKMIIEKHMGGKLTARNIGNGAEFRIEV